MKNDLLPCSVVFKYIHASQIFNACDPAYLYDIALPYKERWWDAEQDSLRQLLHDTFIEDFDTRTGHYTRLRESILAKGILNPIVVTLGEPIYRRPWMVPKVRAPYICETCGGSRLMIATELGLDIPCIVNNATHEEGERLYSAIGVINKFHDRNYTVHYGPPTRVSATAFEHMPVDYKMANQKRCRQLTNQKQRIVAENWKKQNTNKSGA